MKALKVTIIGAGSTYTPEIIDGFIRRKNILSVSDLCLMDINNDRLQVVGGLVRRMCTAAEMDCNLILTRDLGEAISGADFVIAQIRVGGIEARIRDERIPLKYDLIGQETTGAGGFMNALRTIPVMMKIAKLMEKLAPDAWLINFSNPSGIIAEVLLNQTAVKMVGLCNAPINMQREALQRVPEGAQGFKVDYVGLNHLSWITAVYYDGRDVLQDQLTGKYSIYRPRNIPRIELDQELLISIGAIPNSYLSYFYYRNKMLQHLQAEKQSRGEICRELEKELLKIYRQQELREKPAILEQRGGHLYSEAAVSFIEALYNDRNEIHIVNVKNNKALEFMGGDDVVEIGCLVNKNGVQPVPLGNFSNEHIIGMMKTVKSYEKLTAKAGLTGNYADALNALLVHPLVGDYQKAKGVLDEMLRANREFLPQFFS